MSTLVSQVRAAFEEAFRRGLAAVDPRVSRQRRMRGLRIEGPVTVVAIGKAARAMAEGAIDILRGPASWAGSSCPTASLPAPAGLRRDLRILQGRPSDTDRCLAARRDGGHGRGGRGLRDAAGPGFGRSLGPRRSPCWRVSR